MTLRGRANGLAGTPNTSTQLAPNGAISSGSVPAALAVASNPMVSAPPSPASRAARHGLPSIHAIGRERVNARCASMSDIDPP